MKKVLLALSFLMVFGLGSVLAQAQTISGTVTGSEDGMPIPGVSVFVKGTTVGTVTNIDGDYTLNVPESAEILVFSFIGMKTQEVTIGERSEVDVALDPEAFNLDEIIVSGVAAGTPKAKMSVSVSKVGSESLEEVPATSAASALQGKVSGVTVTQSSGNPGQAATIIIRGATQMVGSQDPLIIVDGVMVDGTLADINVNDIESMEVVKGASAAALYGSRAGNGVIVITTKSGRYLAEGETVVRVRNEYGFSELANKYELAEHHQFELADDWGNYSDYTKYAATDYPEGYQGGWSSDINFSRTTSVDNYMDNPYAKTYDHQEDFFSGSESYTNYISVEGNLGKTNFLTSFENSKQGGVIDLVDGFQRQNFRINLNHRLSDKISISATNLYAKSLTDQVGNEDDLYNGGVFFNLLLMQPDVNLELENEDGQPYQFIPDPWMVTTENPLYNVWKRQLEIKRDRVISSFAGTYSPFDWMDVEARYSFEYQSTNEEQYEPYDTFERGSSGAQYSEGSLLKYSSRRFDETAQATMNLQDMFGYFTIKGKLSYLYERRYFESMEAEGENFAFNIERIADFDNISDVANINADNYTTEEVTRNYFGITSIDYKGKYIFDGMFRMDGSSLFGEEERWNPYYRVSGAYRITEDFSIPGFQELKIRSAYGTSGQRPLFHYQYETMTLSSGQAYKDQLGNVELKPSRSTEWEVGLNAYFLNRFDLEATYSNTVTEDQFLNAPQAVHAGGWESRWVNAGTLDAKTIEVTLGAEVFDTPDFKWNATLIFDKAQTEVTELDIPEFQYGPQGQEADKLFKMAEGEEFGTMYGYHFLTSLDELAGQLGPDESIGDYEINSDGYVVPVGSQGTNEEIPVMLKDENGQNAIVKIGAGTPDFNLKFSNSLKYKNVSLYMLWDWRQGGDIYNKTAQWLTRDNRWAKMDQAGKPEYEKKTVTYYKGFYAINEMNDYWVEDGTFLKLRELSLYYTFNQNTLNNIFGGFVKGIKIGFIGRNLLTITDYSGYDPEVQTWTETGSQYYPYDFAGYPNYRTYSGSIEFKF